MSYRLADSLRAGSGRNWFRPDPARRLANSTCFGQFLCPSSGVFHCTHSNGICHTGLLSACEQDQDGFLSWSCFQAVSKPLWHITLLCVQWKTPDDGQRNSPKHVQFYSKNKFEKLVHLVGFIIRVYHLYVKFVKSQRGKGNISIGAPKKNCKKPTRQYDIKKQAENNLYEIYHCCL